MNNELFNDVIATNNHLWSLGKHIFLEHEIDINYILHVPFFRHIFQHLLSHQFQSTQALLSPHIFPKAHATSNK